MEAETEAGSSLLDGSLASGAVLAYRSADDGGCPLRAIGLRCFGLTSWRGPKRVRYEPEPGSWGGQGAFWALIESAVESREVEAMLDAVEVVDDGCEVASVLEGGGVGKVGGGADLTESETIGQALEYRHLASRNEVPKGEEEVVKTNPVESLAVGVHVGSEVFIDRDPIFGDGSFWRIHAAAGGEPMVQVKPAALEIPTEGSVRLGGLRFPQVDQGLLHEVGLQGLVLAEGTHHPFENRHHPFVLHQHRPPPVCLHDETPPYRQAQTRYLKGYAAPWVPLS